MLNYKHQETSQVVDITAWNVDQEFGDKYPEGARAKDLLISPNQSSLPFVKPNWRYMFKYSRKDCPEQFWVEILAYRLGVKMNIDVPPAFVAFSKETSKTASLIEWFYTASETLDYPFDAARLISYFRKFGKGFKSKSKLSEIMYQGGDFCKTFIHNFDEKKGTQHNFLTIIEIMNFLEKTCDFEKAWKKHWAKTLLFDALIGNKDRHQNNWGVIFDLNNNRARLSPVFDNGTSMAYRHQPLSFITDEDIAKYVDGRKSTHHMKWDQNDEKPAGHLTLLEKFIERYPEQKYTMSECLEQVDEGDFADILGDLEKFDVPVKLSQERAELMLKLLKYSHAKYRRALS